MGKAILPLAGLTIFVMEDESCVADALRRALAEAGADAVYVCGETSDAMQALKERRFCLALLDIDVRGEVAFPVADTLAEADVPFGFVTGSDKRTIPARFAKMACWRKPIDHPSLVRDIETIWGIR